MLLVLIFVFFYEEPIMPLKPDTVAVNLVYFYDGSLADMLKDLGGQTTNEMNGRVSQMDLRYKMGYAPGSGGTRLAVLAIRGGGTGGSRRGAIRGRWFDTSLCRGRE
jgi:hypothetical protein